MRRFQSKHTIKKKKKKGPGGTGESVFTRYCVCVKVEARGKDHSLGLKHGNIL